MYYINITLILTMHVLGMDFFLLFLSCYKSVTKHITMYKQVSNNTVDKFLFSTKMHDYPPKTDFIVKDICMFRSSRQFLHQCMLMKKKNLKDLKKNPPSNISFIQYVFKYLTTHMQNICIFTTHICRCKIAQFILNTPNLKIKNNTSFNNEIHIC